MAGSGTWLAGPRVPASLYEALTIAKMGTLSRALSDITISSLGSTRHGTLSRWHNAIATLPRLHPSVVQLQGPTLQIGGIMDADQGSRLQLRQALRQLMPWRKGPFNFFGIGIDSEWRSDWKWQRLARHIPALQGQQILDVGCGNGYYAWRMLGAGARGVLGLEPNLLFTMQVQATRCYLAEKPFLSLPMRLQDFVIWCPDHRFDSVFSMGVLYHQRDPLQHLSDLASCLRAGGTLIVETLIVETQDTPLYPARSPGGRYAMMNNVHCIPTITWMMTRLLQVGLCDPVLLHKGVTTTGEQRSTDWMRFYSLAKALHPRHPRQTIEGHPRPVRALFMARKG